MDKQIPPEKLELFDLVVKELRTAIKNSVLYEPDHPLFGHSIKNLKDALNKWFAGAEKIDIGVAQDSLLLDKTAIKEKKDLYKEVAEYLHMRGILAVSIERDVDDSQLNSFFALIKQNPRVIRKKGGILKDAPPMRNIKIKEIDYSALLTSKTTELETEEEKVWQALVSVVEQSKGGGLPDSKEDFLVDFLEDPEKASKVLNVVYKKAVDQMQDDEAVKNIRETIAKVCDYFEKKSNTESRKIRTELMKVISQLDADLVTGLFEKTQIEGQEFDMAEEVTRGFSDNFIAGFIENLISGEDTLNENLLKVFDKLAPGAEKSENVVTMVADKLFSKRILNPDTLTKLQMSIRDVFKGNPDNKFMSEMYKITVDAVANKKIDTLVYVANLAPKITEFVQSMEEDNLKKEEVWLLLNVLWLENDDTDFKKFGEKLVGIMPELLDSRDMTRVKESMEFLSEKLRPEQKKNNKVTKEAKETLEQIASIENMNRVVSYIPGAKTKEMEEIAYVLVKAKHMSPPMLVDAFLAERSPAYRDKIRFVLSQMKEETADEVVDRLEYCDASEVKDLFKILKECSDEKSHLVAIKLCSNKNPQVRWEGLEGFIPVTGEEKKAIFRLVRKERNENVQGKAIAVILSTKNTEMINRLFKYARMNFLRPNLLLTLVEACGHARSQESFTHLKNIFTRKVLFSTKARDELRIAALTSLGRLGTDKSIALVESGLRDKSERVRKMCEIIMKLSGFGKAEIKEENKGGKDA
ncbi:MAG: HEAT repeat domain-containing protein [Candidatus Omnitrophica bacterium]|nr:HEAT repeat domain-containing protein [Candidatus Omnitrophota bacterium]